VHSDPTYIVDGVVHYCVTNMPGAVGRGRRGLRHGLNVVEGEVTNRAVAETFGLPVGDAGLA